jgi:hypothetical protein
MMISPFIYQSIKFSSTGKPLPPLAGNAILDLIMLLLLLLKVNPCPIPFTKSAGA